MIFHSYESIIFSVLWQGVTSLIIRNIFTGNSKIFISKFLAFKTQIVLSELSVLVDKLPLNGICLWFIFHIHSFNKVMRSFQISWCFSSYLNVAINETKVHTYWYFHMFIMSWYTFLLSRQKPGHHRQSAIVGLRMVPHIWQSPCMHLSNWCPNKLSH